MDFDLRVRVAAFEHLSRLTFGEADVPVTWADLTAFTYQGKPCRLVGQRGIWKPKILDLPVSIATAPPKHGRPAPYADEIRDDDTVLYRYQGTDPNARDNVGLRQVMWEKRPLIYLHGLSKGVYLAAWPVFLLSDDPKSLAFLVDLSPATPLADRVAEGGGAEAVKRYVFVPTRQRLHQARFRERVLRAYRRRCSICCLGHERLLDAAHIIPDAEGGSATTSNGLTLCKIHHAAFDANILGIDPELVVHVREDVLEEVDGPMLQHGIKEMHGQRLRVIPRPEELRPSRDSLDERFRGFLRA